MKKFIALAGAALLLGISQSASAANRQLDCPLRDAPFSASSPLIDVLLSPTAKGALERELGMTFDRIPPQFAGTQAPTFAAILSVREAAGFFKGKPGAIERADAALRALPVTDADRIARCMRYDDDKPTFALPRGKPRILLFEKMTGFRDGPSVEAAHAAFTELARANNWTIVSTDKGGAIDPATLRQFDAVIWNNVSGDVLTLSQRRALRQFIEQGGGFVAVHGSAGDPAYFWDWYADRLIGARFSGHPVTKQFQTARVKVEADAGALAAGLPSEWLMNDEWYSFKTNPRAIGATVIATLDESTYSPEGFSGQDLRMGDHPIAWTNCVGRGRMFYAAIGHRPEVYSDPNYRTLLRNALAATIGRKQCKASR